MTYTNNPNPLTRERVQRISEEKARRSNLLAYENRDRFRDRDYPNVDGSWPTAASWVREFIRQELTHPGPQRHTVHRAFKQFRRECRDCTVPKQQFIRYFLTEAWHFNVS